MVAVLSLDFGTGGARAAIFDTQTNHIVARGEAPYKTQHLPPNRAEQNPEDWMTALVSLVPDVVAKAGSPDIAAVCVATFASTVVLCDRSWQADCPCRPLDGRTRGRRSRVH